MTPPRRFLLFILALVLPLGYCAARTQPGVDENAQQGAGGEENLKWKATASKSSSSSFIPVQSSQIPVLLKLKKDLKLNQPRFKSWGKTDVNCSSWSGIECDSEGHVVSIVIKQWKASGSIPSYIGDLDTLQTLDLSSNNFNGGIPSTISNLKSLTTLKLKNCRLSGNLGLSLGGLPNLEYLDLEGNNFNGNFPSLSGSTKLVTVVLRRNHLGGAIPGYIGSLPALKDLYCASNSFTGGLPNSLFGSNTLENIDFSLNLLKGSLPTEVGNVKTLQTLRLVGNKFSGPLPDTLGDLPNLVTLSLVNNSFTGEIPDSLGKLKKIEGLYLSLNGFTGRIPTSLGTLKTLKGLDLSLNKLVGEVPSGISQLSNVNSIALLGNYLTGPLPYSGSGSSGQRFTFFNMFGNYFSGDPLPDDVTNVTEGGQPAKWDQIRQSSLAKNCLTFPSAWKGVKEFQRPKKLCLQFCGTTLTEGACGGHGYCTLSSDSSSAECVCDSGYKPSQLSTKLDGSSVTYPSCVNDEPVVKSSSKSEPVE